MYPSLLAKAREIEAQVNKMMNRLKAREATIKELVEALERALPTIEQDIQDFGPCDHDVNLCVCGLKSDAEAIRTALECAKARGE